MRDIRRIGICGVGQMGAAAVAFRRAGYPVPAWNHQPERLAELPARTQKLEGWLDEHLGPAACERGRIEVCSDLRDLDERADAVAELIKRRHTQIVRQLVFLRELENSTNHPQQL